ncbi:MAG: ribonuclease R [Methylobacterium sp.]|nr:ribonuclease R [Methylobacterium sp.]
MTRRPKTSQAHALPSREDILAFLANAPDRAGKNEIARHFHLNASERVTLKRMLKDMQAEGLLEKRQRRLIAQGQLGPVLIGEVIGRDSDGELLAIPVDWNEARGEAPRIVVILPKRGGRDAPPPPGPGDRALMKIEPTDEEDGPAYEGRILKMLSRPAKRMLGVFRMAADGTGRVLPVDRKGQGREVRIHMTDHAARDGDLVTVDLQDRPGPGLSGGKIRERLGSLKSERAVSLIAIHNHEIPYVFSEAALEEAGAAQEPTLEGREDWRAIPLITIDPADAKDHDDAVHAEADPDPENPGGYILHIAIADVAAYVRPGSVLDREARLRGNSVYFPDRVVPMLPERISNNLCSLKPGLNRAAMGLRVVVDRHGMRRAHSFHRVLMRSAAKIAYPQAQSAIDGQPDDTTGPLLEPVLKPLYGAYAVLKAARDAREPLDLDLPERKLVLDPQGLVTDVIIPERLDAHRLIEEFMILANVCAAETLEKARIPLLYRVHDAPSLEKMQVLRDFLDTVGITLPKQGAVRPTLFNRILARVKESPNEVLTNEIILRSQAQAEYAPENIGHFGLNLRRYAHFTSPIRRYSDLVVHRGLIRAHAFGEDGLPDTLPDAMKKLGEDISACERRAMAAERETADRLIAQFLAEQVGASFSGRVTGVTRAGLFIRLDRTGADGLVPISTLGEERFIHDEAAHALVGQRTGESFRLGDAVKVRLVEALPFAGALRFEMLSEGRYVKVSRGRSRLRPRDDPRERRQARRNTRRDERPGRDEPRGGGDFRFEEE